jgi:hypothetical protein
MAEDELRQFEAVLGAISKMTSDTDVGDLVDAKCPKCGASDFVSVVDLYDIAALRAENGEPSNVPREGGLTDEQIMRKFAPPQKKAIAPRVAAVTVPLLAAGGWIYHRYGDNAGELALIAAGVLIIGFALTSARKLSGDYYDRRARWRKTYLCRQCGQLVLG